MKKSLLVGAALLISMVPIFGQRVPRTRVRVAKIEVTPSPFPPESLIKLAATFKQKSTEVPHAGAYMQLRAYEVAETDGEPGGKTESLTSLSAEVPAIPSDGSEVTVTFTDFKLPKIAADKSLYLKVWYVSKPFKLDNLYSAIGSAKFRCDFKGDATTSRCLFVPN